MNHEPIKLKSGKELPLIDLKGKPYLQVAHRIVWFRDEHKDWSIETEIVERGGNDTVKAVIFKAYIKDSEGRVIATATKSENSRNFRDYIEKAETGAIGRALALCGYGTQFEPEFDEGERLADAPVDRAKTPEALGTPVPLDEEMGIDTSDIE